MNKWDKLRILFAIPAILILMMTGLISAARAVPIPEPYFLTYTSTQSGETALYRISPDGSRQTLLTNRLMRVGTARWSPRDLTLVYLEPIDPFTYGIRSIRWNSAADHVITQRRANLIRMDWMPDGADLLIESGLWDFNEMSLYRAKAASGSAALVRETFGEGAIYSPDGQSIAFHSRRDGAYQIYVMQSDGTNERQLTQGSLSDYALGWSPDGERILFVRMFLRDFGALYDIRPDGSDQRRLTPDLPASPPEQASYSPDGRWIVYTQGVAGQFDIYVVAADGGEPTRLTDDTSNDYQPVWSPDSRWIAFVSDRDGVQQIYRMRPDGSEVQRVTTGTATHLLPAWSPVYGLDWRPALALIAGVGLAGAAWVGVKR